MGLLRYCELLMDVGAEMLTPGQRELGLEEKCLGYFVIPKNCP